MLSDMSLPGSALNLFLRNFHGAFKRSYLIFIFESIEL